MVDALFAAEPDAAPLRRGNAMARQRMIVLYDRSVTWGGLVVGTGNKTESLIGYTTHLRRQRLRVQPDRRPVQEPGPPARRRPSACPTRSSARRRRPTCGPARPTRPRPASAIPVLDRLLYWRIDRRRSVEEVVALGFDARAGRARRPDGRRRRVQAPGAADRQARAADGRHRLPVPASPAGFGPRVTADPGDAASTAGGTLYVVATPIGNLADVTLRALEVLREVPLVAAEDTRLTRRLLDRHGIDARLTSFHAQSGPGRLAALLEHLRGGADLALVTDAGTPLVSDPGADLVAAWAAEGGRVVPIPGRVGRAGRGRGQRRGRTALVVRGVPAALRARPSRAAGRDRRRSAGHGRLRGAGPDGARRCATWPRPAAPIGRARWPAS